MRPREPCPPVPASEAPAGQSLPSAFESEVGPIRSHFEPASRRASQTASLPALGFSRSCPEAAQELLRGRGGGNLKTIVCQTCLHSDTKTYPFGQLPSQSYRGVQSGWEMATVAQKMLLEKGGGTQNTNRPSEMRPKMHTVVQKRSSPSQLASQAFSDERSTFCVAFPLNGRRFGLPRAHAEHDFATVRRKCDAKR